ncbi:unnamed protein product [Boreogadus saida]
MDPADKDDSPVSLAARVASISLEVHRQGALGEEHSRNLREVSVSLSRFATAMSSLESRVALLSPSFAGSPPTGPVVRREPYVPTLAPYEGDPGAFFSRGVALTWASAEMDRGASEASNYLAFTRAMRRTFDHPVRGETSSADHRHLPRVSESSQAGTTQRGDDDDDSGSYPPPLPHAPGKRTGSIVMGVYRYS